MFVEQKENSGAWLWCAQDDFMIDAIRKVRCSIHPIVAEIISKIVCAIGQFQHGVVVLAFSVCPHTADIKLYVECRWQKAMLDHCLSLTPQR